MSPVAGVGGVTLVTVFGSKLDGGSSRRCRFGSIEVAATLRSGGGALLCVAPLYEEHFAGQLNVSVSLNGLQFTPPKPSMRFVYIAASGTEDGSVRITSLDPSLGPISGGTVVSVKGANFVPVGVALSCRFGAIVVLAQYVSSSEVHCTSPQLEASVSVAVQVSLFSHQVARYAYSWPGIPVAGQVFL